MVSSAINGTRNITRRRRVDSHYFVYSSSFTITSTNSIVFTITFVHCTTCSSVNNIYFYMIHQRISRFGLPSHYIPCRRGVSG